MADIKKIKRKVFIIFPLGFVAVCLMLFLPAGSFEYWQGWVFIGIIFVPCIYIVSYLLKHDPELLRRRMQYSEKETQQKIIIKISGFFFFVGFLIPGFDFRYGWSDVPITVVVISNIFVLLGYLLCFRVFKENTYTSRIIEVEKGQKVISTGPYAVIRHPMYFGVMLMYISMSTALGSYWAIIFLIPAIIPIIFRIFNEEKVLKKDLPGYSEYMKKVKYRLVPGIW